MSKALLKHDYLINIKFCLLVGLLVFWSGVSLAQTNIWDGSSSNNWNTAANWSLNLVPTSAHDVVFELSASVAVDVSSTVNSLTIRNNSLVTFTSSGGGRTITIDNTNSSIQLGSTLRLQGSTGSQTRSMSILFSGSGRTMDISGTLDLSAIGEGTIFNATNSLTTVSGTIKRTGGTGTVGLVTSTAANLSFLASSNYSHEVNGSSIPAATWASTSTVTISGTTTAVPLVLNQSFGNFIWNATGLSTSINFNPTGIAGNLEINNGTATGQIIQAVTTLPVGGNLTITGGLYTIATGTSRNLNVAGNVSVTGGTLLISSGGGIGTLNTPGNFSHTAPALINESSTGSGRIFFNGTGTPQVFSSGGTVSNSINWTVNSGAFLQMADATTTVTGAGTFTLLSGSTLGIRSPLGITTSGATGNIQVTGARTYTAGSSLVYNGLENQAAGNGLTSTNKANLTIDNPGFTVTIGANTTLTGNLTVVAGSTLDQSTFTLSRSAAGGTLSVEAGSNLRIGGTNTFPSNFSTNTINITSTVEYYGAAQTIGIQNYGNLILSGSGAKSMLNVKTINGDFTMSGNNTTTATTNPPGGVVVGGNMTINDGNTLTLNNNPALTLAGNANISGTVITPASDKIIGGDLTINSSGIWTEMANSDYTISGSITNNGAFTAGGGLYSLDGAGKSLNGTINLASTSITGSYTNSGTLTVSSALGGTGSLTQGENSTLNLRGSTLLSTLDASTNCINTVNYTGTAQTIKGVNYCNLILSGSGNKTLQTGTTSIAGNFVTSGTSSTSTVIGLGITGNVEIGTGTTLTSGSFTHTVGGDWSQSGTFNSSGSTIEFNGSNPATIGVSNFNNLSFTGPGAKNITGSLTVTGNTSISSSVTFTNPATIELADSRQMLIENTGSLTTTGSSKIIITSNSNYINRSTSNPTLEVQQVFTGNKGWRMIGSPVTTSYSNLTAGFETQGFAGSTNSTLQPNLLWWDETNQGTSLQAWRQPNNLSNIATAGRGHYFYVFNGASKPAPASGNYSDALPITMSVTGTEVNLASGIFSFPVTFTARDTNLVAQADTLIEVNQADEGFNMLANPTASVIDFNSVSGWTKTNIDETIYIWDPSTESFLTWNGTTGSLASGKIAPFQAFWIKANASSPVLEISNNNVKSLVSTDFFGRKLEDSPLNINLHVSGEGLEAVSYISFDSEGKEGADPKDAYQLESLAEDWLLLYSYGSTRTKSPLVINHLPSLDEQEKVIPLYLAASKKGATFNGTYIMDWRLPQNWPSTISIVLMDHISKKAINMQEQSFYPFTFRAPELPSPEARKIATGIQNPKTVVFQSPYESANQSARIDGTSINPQRPFTIYIGAFPNDEITYLPDFPKLFAPIPNPFINQTTIRFYLPVADKATIQIFDLLGKPVGSFPANNYEAGIHQLEWIPSAIDLPAGMYIIQLATENYRFTQKLIKN